MQVRPQICNLLLWQMTCAWCYQAFWHVFAAAALCVLHCFGDITHARCSDASFSSEHSAPLSAACHDASQQAEVLQRHLPHGLCSASPFWPAQRCPAAAWVLYMSAGPLFALMCWCLFSRTPTQALACAIVLISGSGLCFMHNVHLNNWADCCLLVHFSCSLVALANLMSFTLPHS